MRRTAVINPETQEESERLLGNSSAERPEVTPAVGTGAAATTQQQPIQANEEKPGRRGVLVIPSGSQNPASSSGRTSEGPDGTSPRTSSPSRAPSLDNSRSSSSSGASSADGAQKGEVGLCRICLEEDAASNLEQPCACTGTQKFAHHECIQRWVNEKGHLRCEICDQQYRGSFTVPPPGTAGADEAGNMFSPMFAIRVDHGGEPLGGHHDRAALDFLDESDHYYQRNPLASWCFTFVIFIMFLVVLHHTMIVADGIDNSGSASPPEPPAAGGDPNDYAASLTLFLFWIGTKAFLIGIPLYTVMRIAARQARREQYEAMLRSGAFDVPARRFVWRMQMRDQERAGQGQGAPVGHNVV